MFAGLPYLVKGWVGFDLLNGADWVCWKEAGWVACFVFQLAGQPAVA